MPVTTAYAFCGFFHPSRGGLRETHLILISEATTPSMRMFRIEQEPDGRLLRECVAHWASPRERLLEDLLVMIAIFAEGDSKLAEDLASGLMYGTIASIGAANHWHDAHRVRLYRELRRRRWKLKMVLTVLEGSCLKQQLHLFRNVGIDHELCIDDGAAG